MGQYIGNIFNWDPRVDRWVYVDIWVVHYDVELLLNEYVLYILHVVKSFGKALEFKFSFKKSVLISEKWIVIKYHCCKIIYFNNS